MFTSSYNPVNQAFKSGANYDNILLKISKNIVNLMKLKKITIEKNYDILLINSHLSICEIWDTLVNSFYALLKVNGKNSDIWDLFKWLEKWRLVQYEESRKGCIVGGKVENIAWKVVLEISRDYN